MFKCGRIVWFAKYGLTLTLIWVDITKQGGINHRAAPIVSKFLANILPFIPFAMGGFGKSLYKKYLVYCRIAYFGGEGGGV